MRIRPGALDRRRAAARRGRPASARSRSAIRSSRPTPRTSRCRSSARYTCRARRSSISACSRWSSGRRCSSSPRSRTSRSVRIAGRRRRAPSHGSDVMEVVFSLAIGVLGGAGVWLVLRPRTFQVIMGLVAAVVRGEPLHLQHGQPVDRRRPIVSAGRAADLEHYTDPMPQALVLTAIVIGFATTALFLVVLLASRGLSGTDHVDGDEERVDEPRRCRTCSSLPDRAAAAGRGASAAARRAAPARSSRVVNVVATLARACSCRGRDPAAGRRRRRARSDRRLPAGELGGAVRHRAGRRPAVGADAGARPASWASRAAALLDRRAGAAPASTSIRCSRSS